MIPLRSLLLFVETSNDFVTFKIALNGNYNGTIAGKNEYQIKSSCFFNQ
jgi:hypothetical protein